jgi:hypothetical protein
MRTHRPSRRQLLLTALAGLFGCRLPARAARPAPPPAPAPPARPRRRVLVHRTLYTFNAQAECIRVQQLPPVWEEVPDPAVVVETRGPVITYSYIY